MNFKTKNHFIFLIFISLLSSCNQNKLKTDEQALSQQILTEEEQRGLEAAERKEREKQLADSIARLPKGFRYIEDRSIDKQNPPVVIPISSQFNNKKEMFLSDFVESVDYLALEDVPDTSVFAQTKFDAKISGDKIIIYGLSGLYIYDNSGMLYQKVIENEIQNMEVRLFRGSSSYQTLFTPVNVDYYGEIGEVWPIDNELYFTTLDKANNLFEFRKMDVNKKIPQKLKLDIESQTKEFPGEKLFQLRKHPIEGEFSNRILNSSYTIPLGSDIYMHVPTLWEASKSGKKPVIINKNNDTICSFSNFNHTENFSSTLMSRGSSSFGNFSFRNTTFFYSPLCDTVFGIIPPNRFVPKYVFDYGEYKITPNEYFAPGELKNKLCCFEMFETLNTLLIKYSDLDDNNQIGVYHKNQKDFVTIANSSSGIVDDIIGFYGYWPENINDKREDCRIYRGAELKRAIENSDLKLIQAKNRQEFEKFVNKLSDETLVAIIYKLKP